MTDMAANRASASRSLPPPTSSTHSPVSLHSMSTRSSEALARRQSIQQQQQQHPATAPSTLVSHQQHPEPPGLPPIEGRLTRKRARSINVEEANYPKVDGLSLHSPGLAGIPPSSASTVAPADSICICPSPPKVPRPRNAFILYRQHHQAAVVLKYPGLANPEISKIIGEHWQKESEDVKNSWKRLAEEEKARHQRQYPQYKYQPRRGGKNGPASRPSSAAGNANAEDPGRCPKCGGRYIATPRTPSTPFGSVSGQGGQFGPTAAAAAAGVLGAGGLTSSAASSAMQPFLANNPRMMEAGPPHHQPYSHHQQHPMPHRSSIGAQYHHGNGPEYRRPSYGGYPHPQEPLRPIDEDYESIPPSNRRRGPDEYDMMVSSPDLKRRRFAGGPYDRSPERNLPMSAIPQHPGYQQHQQAPPPPPPPPPPHHHVSPMASSPAPYPQHPGSRRPSLAGPPSFASPQPSPAQQSGFPMTASLPHPRAAVGPTGGSGGGGGGGGSGTPGPSSQRGPGGEMGGMAPPPRPSRLSISNAPPPPPGVPTSAVSGGGASSSSSRGGSAFDESLTLAPLQIPNSPTQNSERSLSSGGIPSGLGIMTAGPGSIYSSGDGGGQRSGSADTQARGIEAMVMSISYLNKLDVLRKISPPLGPPGPGSAVVETRGPVIAIEGSNAALMKAVRPVIERALRGSGECEVKLWMDSSVDNGSSGLSTPPASSREGGSGDPSTLARKKSGSSSSIEADGDVEMGDTQKREKGNGGRHNSVGSNGSSNNGGSLTPVPPPAAARRGATTEYGKDGSNSVGMYQYLQTIMSWHTRSAEIIKHITTPPSLYSPTITSPDVESNKPNIRSSGNSGGGGGGASSSSSSRLLPVALISGGFSLTLSDRFASTVAITDPYSPVDHWQWMATLWRGIVGADLVIYVRDMTPDEVAMNSGTVEYRVPGVMVVRVVVPTTGGNNVSSGGGERGNNNKNTKIDEKTERRLAFEVMEWVRAGSFRDGYAFGGGSIGGGGGDGY